MLVPASLALVVQAFPGERRTHAVGLWGAAAALASGLGPPIGGVLVDLGGWRWAFLVNLPFGLIALVAARTPPGREPGAGAPLAAGPRRRGDVRPRVGSPHARHRPGQRVGVDELGRPRLLPRRGHPAGRLRRQVARPPFAASRPAAAPDPAVRRRQPRHGPRGHGLLRLPAHQHPVAHLRVGLLDPRRRTCSGPCGARRHRRGCRARPGGAPPGVRRLHRAGRADLGGGVRLVRHASGRHAGLPGRVAPGSAAERSRRGSNPPAAWECRPGRGPRRSLRHRLRDGDQCAASRRCARCVRARRHHRGSHGGDGRGPAAHRLVADRGLLPGLRPGLVVPGPHHVGRRESARGRRGTRGGPSPGPAARPHLRRRHHRCCGPALPATARGGSDGAGGCCARPSPSGGRLAAARGRRGRVALRGPHRPARGRGRRHRRPRARPGVRGRRARGARRGPALSIRPSSARQLGG